MGKLYIVSLYTLLQLFSALALGQEEIKVYKLPDFMFNYISLRDSIHRPCFCFDYSEYPIEGVRIRNLDEIKYCKILEEKKFNGKSNWKYDVFIKKFDYEILAEYYNIDDKTWIMKKYKNDTIISEEKIRVTDEIVQTATVKTWQFIDKIFISAIHNYYKTEIID